MNTIFLNKINVILAANVTQLKIHQTLLKYHTSFFKSVNMLLIMLIILVRNSYYSIIKKSNKNIFLLPKYT